MEGQHGIPSSFRPKWCQRPGADQALPTAVTCIKSAEGNYGTGGGLMLAVTRPAGKSAIIHEHMLVRTE
jgi:hypothetical protein